MQIKKIRIQGFKSLEDVTFEPETGFSCLVGSNGAGKSNFCDALLFFQSIILNGVENTLNNFINVELIKNHNSIVSLDFLMSNNSNYIFEYCLKINLENKSIEKECIKHRERFIYQREKSINKLLNIDDLVTSFEERVAEAHKHQEKDNFKDILKNAYEDFNALKEGIPEKFIISKSNALSSDKSGLSAFFEEYELLDFFKELSIFRINPLVPKLPNKVFNKSNLLMHGENLATILSELKKDEDKWQTLHEWLGLIVPSISEVEVKQGEFDSSLSLHFNENGKLLPAISISDGTIYTLSILAAILWNQDKNTLLVIEEPERGIHPQAITELINFMREATTQHLNIITTTHSETFVRNCKLEELWLVDKVAGKTQLKSAKQQNSHLKEASLDQAWLMNLFNGGLPW